MSWSRLMPVGPDDHPWAEMYRHLYPEHTRPRTRYDAWKYASAAVHVVEAFWEARESARAAYESEHSRDPSGWPFAHPPVLLWMPHTYTAACLRCGWAQS